uniref:Uncharacterized protein n=1 Tax=Oryza punctata TaxID=4537 RepID=A0A0E0LVM1_ORYPU
MVELRAHEMEEAVYRAWMVGGGVDDGVTTEVVDLWLCRWLLEGDVRGLCHAICDRLIEIYLPHDVSIDILGMHVDREARGGQVILGSRQKATPLAVRN